MDLVTPVISLVRSLIKYVSERVITSDDFDKRIQKLEAALEELNEVRDDLKKQVDQAELLGLTLSSQVKGWLARVERVGSEVTLIRDDMNLKKQCLCCCNANCVSRHEFSKRVTEKLILVTDLKGKGKLEVGLPDGLLLVPVVEIPNRPVVGLDLMLDNVQTLLREENVGTIGIYGMGGVGKTTLLKCINNGLLSLGHDFEVVIWAVVSKDFVIERLNKP